MDYRPYGCPIRYGASVLGDRWCLMIIRDLMFKNRRYYREFLEAGEGISTNILANRLQRLEEAGIITKEPDPEHGKRFIYTLTEKGVALLPILVGMMQWAAKYDEDTEMPRAFTRKLLNDPATLLEELETTLNKKTP